MNRDLLDLLDGAARDRLRREDLPRRVEPALATLTDDHFSDPGWIYERKFDGQRVIASRHDGRVRLRSRRDQDLGSTYPELVDALQDGGGGDVVLDGEVVAFDGTVTSFARLQGRMGITDERRARRSPIRIAWYAFDVLHLHGYSVRGLALRDRKRLLRRAVSFDDPVRFTAHRNEAGAAYLDEACSRGWEGLIAKDAAATYPRGRSSRWLKFKCVLDQEVVIAGYTAPKGSRDRFGALLVGHHDRRGLRYAGKVGTGFDQRTLERLGDLLEERRTDSSPFVDEVGERGARWVAPELVAQVRFTEWTGDGRLRHPRYVGLRTDREAAEVVRETPE
jgi:bifunctional non-homologous end joining protein LigD